jgi:putative methyltransferase (TIGR04325 family)
MLENDSTKYKLGEVVPPPYFFGVHPPGLQKVHFDDPFNTEGWVDHCRRAANKLGIRRGKQLANPGAPRWKLALHNAKSALRTPSLASQLLTAGSACPRYLLPVAAMIHDVQLRRGRVTVLDVGGGFGDNFFELLRILRRDAIAALDYRVVDNPRSCDLGRELYADFPIRPTFYSDHTSLPADNDIVLVVGTLQYIGDWPAALASISEKAGRYLYVARTPITQGESFSTTQLVCPAYGSMAGRNLGATTINVVGMRALRAALSPPWTPMFEFRDVDYSPQFARLPATHREVAYYNHGWQRPGES